MSDSSPSESKIGKDGKVTVKSPWMAMVKEFHTKFPQLIADKPGFPDDENVRAGRISLLEEEWQEYKEAEASDDLVEVADALGDMVYVIAGTALAYGIPLDRVFQEIHDSNMTKDPTSPRGKKIRKGPEFVPVDLSWIKKG